MKLRNFFALFLSLICGCTLLPGMQNISARVPAQSSEIVNVDPTVIPIHYQRAAPSLKPEYFIGTADTLNISVWKHPEFDFPLLETRANDSAGHIFANQFNYPVDAYGRIYFPLIGYLQVAGKNIDTVRVMVTKRLKKYIRNPQIVVRIAEFRSKKVYVLGEVEKPNLLYLNDQAMSLMDAIMLAGSINPNTGDPRYIYVIRGDLTCPKIYWLNANSADALLFAKYFNLEADDIIYVSTAMVTRWNRFLSQLLPSLQTIWYTKAITGK